MPRVRTASGCATACAPCSASRHRQRAGTRTSPPGCASSRRSRWTIPPSSSSRTCTGLDEALLAFVEHLATHAAGVPLLVVATARPELLERRPAFAAGSTHVNRLSVDPLTPDEAQQLVTELLGDTEALSDTVAGIVTSCEGNPFFAEQSARLVADQVRWAPVPASVQAVLAARLDALPPGQKALLGDAAVVGSVFWDGAIAELGRRDPAEVDADLQGLIGKHLVRRVRRSSMVGENEYTFAHALAREVAYQSLPRAARAARHKDVAAWVEGKAGDRVEDLAEILAHHYATALDLAQAAGDDALADSLVEPAVRYLMLAGDRAWPLDVAAAERHYARALKVAGADSPRRSALLVKWAKAATELGRKAEAVGPSRGGDRPPEGGRPYSLGGAGADGAGRGAPGRGRGSLAGARRRSGRAARGRRPLTRAGRRPDGVAETQRRSVRPPEAAPRRRARHSARGEARPARRCPTARVPRLCALRPRPCRRPGGPQTGPGNVPDLRAR